MAKKKQSTARRVKRQKRNSSKAKKQVNQSKRSNKIIKFWGNQLLVMVITKILDQPIRKLISCLFEVFKQLLF